MYFGLEQEFAYGDYVAYEQQRKDECHKEYVIEKSEKGESLTEWQLEIKRC